jgi:Cys-tRNA(Pro)/Cys-tRNA(Cys) deacylase
MTELPPVSLALTALGLPHRVFRHPGPVSSLEQAARERGQSPEQVIRSIVFRIGAGEFIMVLIAGPAQVSWPALRNYLGQSRLTMATEDEVLAVTGYRPGAVSPFGLPAPLRILADENVFAPAEISLGSGERGVTIIMKSADLRQGLEMVDVGQFAQG